MKVSSGLILYTEDNEVLGCLPRGKTVYEHNLDLPKGEIEEGEDPKDAVVREVIEETGLVDVSWWRLNDIGEFPYLRDKKLHLFVYKVSSGERIMNELARRAPRNNTSEHAGFKLVKFEDIPKFFSWELALLLKKICTKLEVL